MVEEESGYMLKEGGGEGGITQSMFKADPTQSNLLPTCFVLNVHNQNSPLT